MAASNCTNRRDLILDLVKENTASMLELPVEKITWIHAGMISESLQMDRANVARELNSLYRDGYLIKLQGKPTLYLSRDVLQQHYPNVFFPSTMPKGSRLEDYTALQKTEVPPNTVKKGNILTELDTQIGAGASLKNVVQYAKAAVMYPGHNMHTLITGHVGVGKAQLAHKMYQHAVAKGSLPQDAPFVSVNCQDYSTSPRLLMSQLFGFSREAAPKGDKGRRGLIDRAAGGILCLNGVERLHADAQEALVTLLEKNTYTRVGEPSVIRHANVMVIAISTEPAQTPALQVLSQRFPVQISLPDLAERSPQELAELLLDTLQAESKSTNLNFRISKEVFVCFLKSSYPGNLGELNSAVRTACSLVYLENASGSSISNNMEICFRHLPPEMLQNVSENSRRDHEINVLLSNNDFSYILFTPAGFSTDRFTGSHLLDILHGHNQPKYYEAALPAPVAISAEYLLYSLKRNHGTRFEYRDAVKDTFPDEITDAIRLALSHEDEYMFILKSATVFNQIAACIQDNMLDILEPMPNADSIRAKLEVQCEKEMHIVLFIEHQLGAWKRTLSNTAACCIASNLYKARHLQQKASVAVILACHGKDVAENLADYVNSLLSSTIVHGLSYQPGMNFGSFLEQMDALALEVDQGSGVLLMADMAPLTELHEHIIQATGIHCETVPNVSLPLLLSVCQRIQDGNTTISELSGSACTALYDTSAQQNDLFENKILSEVLTPSLTFLNPKKAMDVANFTLTAILQHLQLAWSAEIAAKFILHCCYMIERLILKDPLRYDHLKLFINRHSDLMEELEQQMQYVSNVFGITIPSSEIAYIADIFIPYM